MDGDGFTISKRRYSSRIRPCGRHTPHLPPSYSIIIEAGGSRAPVQAGRDASDHSVFEVRSGFRNKPWATLRLQKPILDNSRQKSVLIYGEESLTGVLDFDLDSPQSINSISLNIKGKIAIWSRDCGDPVNRESRKPYSGKFAKGTYSFPFAFPFPSHVSAATLSGVNTSSQPTSPFLFFSTGSTEETSNTLGIPVEDPRHPELGTRTTPSCNYLPIHPLPPSFAGRGLESSVAYELALCISHKRLRSDSKPKIPVTYVPSILPPPSSVQRQSAYRKNTPLPGRILGSILDERGADLECKVSLAQPLTYTRGMVIPCHITISGQDIHVLDVLVQLTRRVSYELDMTSAGGPSSSDTSHVALSVFEISGEDPRRSRKVNTQDEGASNGPPFVSHKTVIETAQWWIPPKDEQHSPTLRVLHGEIHLPQDMPPTSLHLSFFIEYAVELLSFRTSLFRPRKTRTATTSMDRREQVYVHHPATIATIQRLDEPPPVSFIKRKSRLVGSRRGRSESFPT
ncbi:hypothetical protein CC1G_07715 [Coprinopsis cinerea okayama7|uniref:Arrestin-like N-terminal domain-containing protein n=1 Tax=Coprinopsis cinerea (strain Okayama-7 / 130 / ATCC MYA-4618 / FGSC 9003) TaxID=240176 RepID=A8NBW8_COPC7|nr:hypothetical protein CC1G_07715 [Coprinopsis cinerea okayama7\|eukprot:XP_001832328.2 hypothetical protein CC1G_07715 [Coprinopsis cinerea okayama7\